MRVKKANMQVIDRFGSRVDGLPTVDLNGGEEGLNVTIRRSNTGTLEAEIRYEPRDPDLAAEWGNDNDYVLLDWFMVHDVDVTFTGDRLTLTGYMAGAKGFRRNGEAQYEDSLTSGRGVAYTDDGGPLVRVRWDLV